MNGSPNLVNTLSVAHAAESKGQYEKAFQYLSPFWDNYSQFPSAIGLSDTESAELFLRFGGIIGYLGNSQKISNSQEISKNLLTQARRKFLSLSNFVKTAECENYLALAYARTGEFTEAFDWLNESFSRNLPENHPTRINSYVIETLIYMDSGKYKRILKRCEELGDVFERCASDLHRGCFYNHLAMAHKNLGNKTEALENLKAARDFFQKAKHQIYYGAVENNLAQLLHRNGHFKEAHVCAQSAKMIFEQIGDRMREGYSLETRAQIFAAERKYEKALKFVNDAIELLEGGESYRNLVESYRTKIRILLGLNRLTEALTVMTAAHNIAALYISQEFSREIIEGTAALIQEKYGSALRLKV
jgi:tetratricopeptide (TPR) repeat protein